MSEISLKIRLLKQYIERGDSSYCLAYSLCCTDCPLYNKDMSSPYKECFFTTVCNNERMDFAKEMLKRELMELITNEC